MSINHLTIGQSHNEVIVNKARYEALKEVALKAADVAGEFAALRYDCLEKLNDALDRLEAVE